MVQNMTSTFEPTAIPAFATIDEWCRLSGMGRTNTYAALSRGDLQGRKLGKRILIDCQKGLDWMRQLPPAVIKPNYGNKAQHAA